MSNTKRNIKFNSFYSSSNYTKNLEKLFNNYSLFREKHFSNQCIALLKDTYLDSDILLTHSATGALEIIALAIDVKEGDEIILPSYTFVSTANAFALRGAKLIFVDIEMDSFGIDPKEVEKAITPKTKAIIAMHYAGHACKIEQLQEIAKKNQLYLIEDAAMGLGGRYKDSALGSFGDFSVISFDITKHIAAVQGGALLINNKDYSQKCYQIYHTGTNRKAFENGDVPYYEWISLGSKYQLTETNSAILIEQLKQQQQIIDKRKKLSQLYFNVLKSNKQIKLIAEDKLSFNFHEFYIRCSSLETRKALTSFMKKQGVELMFHYIPLHLSFMGRRIGQYKGGNNTEMVSNTLVRLPLHYDLSKEDITFICKQINTFFEHE